MQIKRRSSFWFILPIFFHLIGGVIAFFILKEDDPKKAKSCLFLGLILTGISIGIFLLPLIIGVSLLPQSDFIPGEYYI